MSSKKGFTLVELVVTIAVVAIATTLATLFAVSTAKSFKTEKKKSDAIYNVKDVHDFVFNWISSFDDVGYTVESVTDRTISMKDVSTDEVYSLTYAAPNIVAQTLTGDKTYSVPDVENVTFYQKDNAIKVEVAFSGDTTAFVIYRKTQ